MVNYKATKSKNEPFSARRDRWVENTLSRFKNGHEIPKESDAPLNATCAACSARPFLPPHVVKSIHDVVSRGGWMEMTVDKNRIELAFSLRQAQNIDELNALVSALPFYAWNCEHEAIHDLEAFVTNSGRIGLCGHTRNGLRIITFHNVKCRREP